MSRQRRRGPWGVLAVLFVVVPLVEIYVLIQVGQVIGAWWTILLLIADSVLGSYLIKREGSRAWRSLTVAMRNSQMPARELADGALILVGGTLLLTPGFLSDILGFFCILPLTRPVARRLLLSLVTRKVLGSVHVSVRRGDSSNGSDVGGRTRQRPGPDSVVQGEVVD